jgi:hypothetical protein
MYSYEILFISFSRRKSIFPREPTVPLEPLPFFYWYNKCVYQNPSCLSDFTNFKEGVRGNHGFPLKIELDRSDLEI